MRDARAITQTGIKLAMEKRMTSRDSQLWSLERRNAGIRWSRRQGR
jgi:hypothetical protein